MSQSLPQNLSDAEYRFITVEYEPIWRFVVKHYATFNYDYDMATPVTVLGCLSLPIGIELSQYGYNVHCLLNSHEEVSWARRACQAHAGEKVRLSNLPWLYHTDRAQVCIVLDILDDLDDWATKKFLDMLTTAHTQVITTVNKNYDKKRIEKYIQSEILKEEYVILTLTRPGV